MAEALRHVRQVDLRGITVGLALPDDAIDEVQGLHRAGKDAIAEALLERVKVYNYVPRAAESVFRNALIRDFEKKVRS
ncbi:MAG: hypothetical protein WC382_04350 [Methanoregulaceae archaeon]|jgi:phosphatidylserine/phosphatidylglycerophosphate/cardiolipin synthase-like enzyme